MVKDKVITSRIKRVSQKASTSDSMSRVLGTPVFTMIGDGKWTIWRLRSKQIWKELDEHFKSGHVLFGKLGLAKLFLSKLQIWESNERYREPGRPDYQNVIVCRVIKTKFFKKREEAFLVVKAEEVRTEYTAKEKDLVHWDLQIDKDMGEALGAYVKEGDYLIVWSTDTKITSDGRVNKIRLNDEEHESASYAILYRHDDLGELFLNPPTEVPGHLFGSISTLYIEGRIGDDVFNVERVVPVSANHNQPVFRLSTSSPTNTEVSTSFSTTLVESPGVASADAEAATERANSPEDEKATALPQLQEKKADEADEMDENISEVNEPSTPETDISSESETVEDNEVPVEIVDIGESSSSDELETEKENGIPVQVVDIVESSSDESSKTKRMESSPPPSPVGSAGEVADEQRLSEGESDSDDNVTAFEYQNRAVKHTLSQLVKSVPSPRRGTPPTASVASYSDEDEPPTKKTKLDSSSKKEKFSGFHQQIVQEEESPPVPPQEEDRIYLQIETQMMNMHEGSGSLVPETPNHPPGNSNSPRNAEVSPPSSGSTYVSCTTSPKDFEPQKRKLTPAPSSANTQRSVALSEHKEESQELKKDRKTKASDSPPRDDSSDPQEKESHETTQPPTPVTVRKRLRFGPRSKLEKSGLGNNEASSSSAVRGKLKEKKRIRAPGPKMDKEVSIRLEPLQGVEVGKPVLAPDTDPESSDGERPTTSVEKTTTSSAGAAANSPGKAAEKSGCKTIGKPLKQAKATRRIPGRNATKSPRKADETTSEGSTSTTSESSKKVADKPKSTRKSAKKPETTVVAHGRSLRPRANLKK